MKKHSIYAHEINESIAAKAAMNCLKNRNKRSVITNEDVLDWYDEIEQLDPSKKAMLDIGRKRIDAEFIDWLQQNNVRSLNDLLQLTGWWGGGKFIKGYKAQEEEETTGNDKFAIAKQVIANYNPDMDEWEDPEVWLRYAIQDHIGKQFLKMPKKEVKAWQRAIESTIDEYEFEKQHPAHYEDEDEARLQSQLADAWDEGMEDEDDYVPYNNTFDETHNDIVDNLLSAVEHYFDTDDDVSGFNHHDYTEDQLGKAIEKVLDKYGDFPSSNNFNKCYAWTKKHAGEIIKVLETGSLDNSYEGHPEFDFSEQEEMEVTDAKQALAQLAADLLRYDDGDLDEVYYAISDIIDSEGYSPQPDEYDEWIEDHVDEIQDLVM